MRTKILLLVLFLFQLIYTSTAQVKPNRYLVGGAINFNKSTNPETNNFYTNLQIGKVTGNNTVIGLTGSYASNLYDVASTVSSKAHSYAAGIFYRKYIPLANKLYFFNELDATYTSQRNIQQNYGSSQYYNSKTAGGTISYIPGISYNVWKRLQMELSMPSIAGLSYLHASTIDSALPPSASPQQKDSYGAAINLNSNVLYNFAIGFKFFVGK